MEDRVKKRGLEKKEEYRDREDQVYTLTGGVGTPLTPSHFQLL